MKTAVIERKAFEYAGRLFFSRELALKQQVNDELHTLIGGVGSKQAFVEVLVQDYEKFIVVLQQLYNTVEETP